MKKTIAELEQIYSDAKQADKDALAEERSNVLLNAGEHYTKRSRAFNEKIRSDKTLSDQQKLRITKNHIHKIVRTYVDRILGYSPGVTVTPQKNSELQDQKDAELNKAVWEDAKYRGRFKEKTSQFCEDFITLSACCVKVFWDPMKGTLKGYEPKYMEDEEGVYVDELNNPIPVTDEMGQVVLDKTKPIYTGDLISERIYDFNLFFTASANNFEEAPCVGIEKMVDTKELESRYSKDPEKLKYIQNSKDEAFIIFDSSKQSYERSKDRTLVKEYYFRPCPECPEGYFYITTSGGVLEEGELPFGIFPIRWAGFDVHPTARRAKSIIKVARPFQAEINRASSQVATHQVTLGDDKVIYQQGTKLNPGALLPGVRGITYQGSPPAIINGRTGDQFIPYIQSTIAELYDAVMLSEENEDAQGGQFDAYTQLFKSLRQQKKFARYGDKFQQFLIDWAELYLQLAKQYYPDDMLIYAVGKQEAVNIQEFRNTDPLCYQIRVVEQDETIETKLGKQITMTNILQYVGKQLKPEDIGKIIKAMPFGNVEEAFDDLTIDYENAKNDMLALERGEAPVPNEYENHIYVINQLTKRMKQSDFKYLNPQIQQNYLNFLNLHQEMEAQNQAKIMAAKKETIPTDGALIACDFYIPNSDPNKAAKRVRLPYSSLDWLVKTLENQGKGLDDLERMNQGALAGLAEQLLQQRNIAPNMGAQPSPLGGSGIATS